MTRRINKRKACARQFCGWVKRVVSIGTIAVFYGGLCLAADPQVLHSDGSPRGTPSSGDNDKVPPLNLGAMIQPLTDRHVFKEPDYFSWCPQVFKGDGA